MLIKFKKTVKLPCSILLERLKKAPDLGPRVLFFSGGTALKKPCREIVKYTYNSIHIITPFDSGGSSAVLRKAFNVPAIGDIRNRLLTLADRSYHGNPAVYELFAYRFPKDGNLKVLHEELDKMIVGEHPLILPIPNPMQKIIQTHLEYFKSFMPKDFDLRKASIGNLILTSGYIDTQNSFDIILFTFSKLVRVLGIVKPIVNEDLHLITLLEDETVLIGQHRLTGKEDNPISSKVKGIWLSKTKDSADKDSVKIETKMEHQLKDAELICYPMGSFYSSLIANILPKGVGNSIKKNYCSKIYIPNTGTLDPEEFGMTINDKVMTLISYLTKDDPENIQPRDVLNFVLLDSKRGDYPGELEIKELTKMGVNIIDTELISDQSYPLIDEKLLVPVIMSLT